MRRAWLKGRRGLPAVLLVLLLGGAAARAARVQVIDLRTLESWDVSAALAELAGLEQIEQLAALDTGSSAGDALLLLADAATVVGVSSETWTVAFRIPWGELDALFGLGPEIRGALSTIDPPVDGRRGEADLLLLQTEDGAIHAFDLETLSPREVGELGLQGWFHSGFALGEQGDEGLLWRAEDRASYSWRYSSWGGGGETPLDLGALVDFPPAGLAQLRLPGGDAAGLLFLLEGAPAGSATPGPTASPGPSPTPTPTPTPTGGETWFEAIVANSLGETLSVVGRTRPREVANDVATTGIAPNDLARRGDELFVVNSLSHSIGVYALPSLTIRRELSTGLGTNPYFMSFRDDSVFYVTLLVSNQVAVMDREQGLLELLELPAGDELPRDPDVERTWARPADPVVAGDTLYVSCSNLDDHWAAGGPGIICRFALEDHRYLGMFPSCGRNTVGLLHDPAAFPDLLFVANAGDYESGTGYVGNGTIGAYALSAGEWAWVAEVGDAPVELALSGDLLIAASAASGRLLRLRAATGEQLEPLQLPSGQELSFASGLAVDGSGQVWVTEFNHDELYIVDPRAPAVAEGPYFVGAGPDAVLVLP